MAKKFVYLFSEGNATMRNLLGGKGANLAEMTGLGMPVPQGFTITTEACTQYYEDGRQINPDIQAEIMQYVEKMENICDLKDHAYIGIWKTTVEAMHEPYVMPQDNGNCGAVKYLKLSNDCGNVFTVYGEPKFSFSAHNYTQRSLHNAKHQEDLQFVDSTILCIDGFMRGTGTNTCGPDTMEKYKIVEDSYNFKLRLSAVK